MDTARAQCWFLKHLHSFKQKEIWNFWEPVTLAAIRFKSINKLQIV